MTLPSLDAISHDCDFAVARTEDCSLLIVGKKLQSGSTSPVARYLKVAFHRTNLSSHLPGTYPKRGI